MYGIRVLLMLDESLRCVPSFTLSLVRVCMQTTSLLWRHVSYEQVNELNSTLEPQTCKRLVTGLLPLT